MLGWRLGFLHRPGAGRGHHLRPPRAAGKPALAADPRPGRRSRTDHYGRRTQVQDDLGKPLPLPDEAQAIEVRPVRRTGYLTSLHLLLRSYRRRAVLGASLMITQSFLYNAIFFTYTLVLTRFYDVSGRRAPVYLIAFAVGNLARPADHRAAVRHHRPASR